MIGLGYVGLPLVIETLKANFIVYGIDVNTQKIDNIKSGIVDVEGVDVQNILDELENRNLFLKSDFSSVAEVDIVVICVPTPLTLEHEPDLSYISSAIIQISEFLKNGALIIIESTVGPGTMRDLVLPLIEKKSNLNRNEFYLAYSPERVDPLNKVWNIKNTPKLVSGLTNKSRALASDFYSKFVDKVILCESLEVAETAKLLENSFRFVNISFINEIMMICDKLGINTNAVIRAASTKPYGYMPFYPSIGVGGHCIPVDPIYLAQKAEIIGIPSRFILLADMVNQEITDFFVRKAEDILGKLEEKNILVIGVSYKPNIADVRESSSRSLIEKLRSKGANVFWHDEIVAEFDSEKSTPLSHNFDLAILATHHDYLDLTKLGQVPLINIRGSSE